MLARADGDQERRAKPWPVLFPESGQTGLSECPGGLSEMTRGLTRRLPGEPVVRAAQLSRQRVERQPRRRPGAS